MALVLDVVLATAQFKNAHFVVLALGNHGCLHACTGHQGGADLQFRAVADCQNLIQHDFLAYVRSNLFYLDFFASSNTILFATGFYDRVHTTSFSLEIFRRPISAKPAIVAANKKCRQFQCLCDTAWTLWASYNGALSWRHL